MTWREAVEARDRTIDYRVEAVSMTGDHLADVPVEGVRVSFDGDQAEAWRADFTLTDPAMVPVTPMDALDGRSGTRLRVWWRLLTLDGWSEVPVGTYVVEDPTVRDSGALRISVDGLDPLAVARRGGYGSRTIPVGGMTVSDALELLFSTVAPHFPVSIEPCAEVLPAGMDLWDRDPAQDWREIAEAGGMTVRTNRLGVITVSRPHDSETVAADWQEGPDCPVIDLQVQTKTSTIPRRVVVVSSSPDVTPPIVGEWVNPLAQSQALVTETRIQSSTVTTVQAATDAARLNGLRWSRPTQIVEVQVPPRGDLSYGDLVLLRRSRAGVAGPFRVAGWDLTLGGRDRGPAPMSVRMSPRQWEDS